MAENKKSFIAYCDWKEIFNALPDEKAGQLVKHLFAYVNDENPTTDDILINAVFASIKTALKRDLRKYEEIREKNKENARKRWDKENATASDRINRNANHADNDNVTVNVNEKKNKYVDFIEKFNSVTGKKIRVPDEKFKRQLNARLKDGFTIEEIITAAINCSEDEYHKQNPKYLTPEFITRSDKLQKFLNGKTKNTEESEWDDESYNRRIEANTHR